MALKDIFDRDRRSKDDLRIEIQLRDEKIARLLRDVAELHAKVSSSKNLTHSSTSLQPIIEREQKIEVMERQIETLLTRFGITNKSQIVNIPVQLSAIEQELDELRKSTEAQELFLIREKLNTAIALAEKRANERDELGRTLFNERAKISESESSNLRAQLDAAQIEIKRLKAGTSDEMWNLKRRSEKAEEQLELRESEFRNLNIRIAALEKAQASLRAENELLKKETIPIETHRIAIEKIKHTLKLEKDRADSLKQRLDKSERDLRTAKHQFDDFRKDIESKKSMPIAAEAKRESIFTNPIVLRWLVTNGDPATAEVPNGWLGSVGDGPWPEDLFSGILEDIGYKFWRLPDSDLRHIVIGREGWTKNELLEQIDATEGEPLRIYSQEMFLAKLITGLDPFDSNNEELMLAFAKGHPALKFLLGLPEPWPTICERESEFIEPVGSDDYGVAETPLHILGYHVGVTSDLSEAQRRELLSECFKTQFLKFTDESSEDYRRKWGRGSSQKRLYRMATHIKWLAEGQGKDARKAQARIDWINDLNWLHKTFYNKAKPLFTWPK